jgi:hypothetical protein
LDFNDEEFLCKIAVIMDSELSIDIERNHVSDYFLRNMSENYLAYFSIGDRREFVNSMIDEKGLGYLYLVNYYSTMTLVEDFDFFYILFDRMVRKLISTKNNTVDVKAIQSIAKDYFRIQTAKRMKLKIENPDFYCQDLEGINLQSEDGINKIIIKHEVLVAVICMQGVLERSIELSKLLDEPKAIDDLSGMLERVWTEKPPLPRLIPKYIENFENQKDQTWRREYSGKLPDTLPH